ncbi:single-stranded DNA-binding protein [Streptomyces sp. HGB0020]|jgi:single-strand DNA-binding protein|uniref:single-stranded DNA-binding protein n=1 Tax=Streptomyces sp. HGB0020 TaxID=1078086 RepID=UPI00034DFFBB|nr:single-stranded DNA-binding protein [Streptomyces sp. HGB0020]EPD56379.1 single-stranded DNA-binding protein [Streptomyces sp. HGB0020]
MAGETVITVVGNLVDDPELRFTPSGVAVAKFRVASTPRVFNKTTNEWEDGESLFLTCSVWRQAAENVAESLAKGVRVLVQGRLKQRSYEDGQGVKRTVYELDVDEVGPSLARATATVTKNPAGSSRAPSPADDVWGGATPASGQKRPGGWGNAPQQPANRQPPAQGAGYSDEPPF